MTDPQDRPTLREVLTDLQRVHDIDIDSNVTDALEALVAMGHLAVVPEEPTRIGAVVRTSRRNTSRYGPRSTPMCWTRWTSNTRGYDEDTKPWVSAIDGAHATWDEVLTYGVDKIVSTGTSSFNPGGSV